MDLGQVFTKLPVAEYMTSLFTIGKSAKVLDPCFGEGAFLNALTNSGWNQVYGYELDSNLFAYCKDKYQNCLLKNEDYLSSNNKEQYDGIIMNPPYVRHEKINALSQLGVNKTILATNPIFSFLPTTANLYMYFIIKAISDLKENGELIVIFPSSWSLAKNGDRFGEALYNNCTIERQIHISGDVFEKSALVDIIILKLRKIKGTKSVVPEYVKLENNRFIPISRKDRQLNIGFSNEFKNIGKIRRGLTTGCNEMFINPSISHEERYTTAIISSPKQVTGYTTENSKCDKLLIVNQDDLNDENIADYFREWKDRIIKEGKPKTLVRKIDKGDEWYKLITFDCDGIIFSYFVRSDMKFIVNKSGNIIRDNFYIIFPAVDYWVCFALLNNYYTYYQLECTGKKYGAGLLKLQQYDLESLRFPALDSFSEVDINGLKKLAMKLAATGSRSIVSEITQVLSRYCDISFEEIASEYKNIVSRRLENV